MNIGVWAPQAKSVDVVVGETRMPLRVEATADREGGGCWSGDVDETLLRKGYRFSIDGGPPFPDPRSRWQPQGVHGPSFPAGELPAPSKVAGGPGIGGSTRRPARSSVRVRPLHDAVIYEMHVGTFTAEGTYAAARAKLPHLASLGVTHLELMPLATFPGRHGWGYDGVGLYAPHPAYGTPQDLAAFVQACHAQGLRVLLDVVYNHLGPDGNYLAQSGPYFTDHYKTGWGAALNFDGPGSDGVRRFVIDNALMWLSEYGFDGLRLDAVHAIFSFDATHVLEELAAAVRRLARDLGRTLVLIAESDLNDPRLVRPVRKGGLGLDAQWSDDFHHALHAYFTGETSGYYADFHGLAHVAEALAHGYVYRGQFSSFRRRRHGRPPHGVGADQLVVFSQNHDQIGNRAQGERLSMLLEVWQLKAIAAMTVLSPFVPLLFQGEEWGATSPFLYFTDHEDAALGRAVAEGRAREFAGFRWQGEVPNPQEARTFERSRLDWAELEAEPHRELFEWYRRLIELRHERIRASGTSPSRVRRGERRGRDRADGALVEFNERAQWLWFTCGGLLAQFNFSSQAQTVPAPEGAWERRLSSVEARTPSSKDAPALELGQSTSAMEPGETRVLSYQRITESGVGSDASSGADIE